MGYLQISGKKLLKKIKKMGGFGKKKVGSHMKVILNDKITTIPIHNNQDLPKGTLKKILKDLGLNYNDIKN